MKTLATAILLVGALLMTSQAASDGFRIAENLRHKQVVLPATTPERGRMTMVQKVTFFDSELGSGLLVFYDDPRTKRHFDYIELYDLSGDLLVVSWIDRFGSCQAAMDRGLLDSADPRIEGIFVIIEIGNML